MNPSQVMPRLLKGALFLSLLIATGLLSAAASQATSLPSVSVALTPSAITVGGTLESGAVNVVSTATGGSEPSTTLILLKPGVSPAEIYALLDAGAIGHEPNLATKYASIVFDGPAAPGKTTEAQTILAPGQYVAINAEGEKS